jgi:hypothetical protein
MRRLPALSLLVSLAACGGSTPPAAAPTAPTPAPAPTPTPTPNPFAAACGNPLPAFEDSYGFHIKVQLEPSRNKKVLNASPQLRNAEYCQAAGLFGVICNTRNEFESTRVPCDHYLSGISDTGAPGPNWFQMVNGNWRKCPGDTTAGDAPNCRLKPENQYLLDVFAGGAYRACGGAGSPGTCSTCVLDDTTFGVIHDSPAGLCQVGDFSTVN